MNLGNIYIGAFLALTAAAIGLSLLVGLCLRTYWRVPWGKAFGITVLLAVLSVVVANRQLHQPLFRAWHRAQNNLVPAAGCVSYEPEFARLLASYRMTRPEFDAWVAQHSWKLQPGKNSFLDYDGPMLGIDAPEANYETKPAPNGKQLRIYYKAGRMYLSYYSM